MANFSWAENFHFLDMDVTYVQGNLYQTASIKTTSHINQALG